MTATNAQARRTMISRSYTQRRRGCDGISKSNSSHNLHEMRSIRTPRGSVTPSGTRQRSRTPSRISRRTVTPSRFQRRTIGSSLSAKSKTPRNSGRRSGLNAPSGISYVPGCCRSGDIDEETVSLQRGDRPPEPDRIHFGSEDRTERLPERRRSRRLSQMATDISAPLPNLVPGSNDGIIKSLFSDVFDKATISTVEVEQCVSLSKLRARKIRAFGVKRMMGMLQGGASGIVTGHISVGKFPVVTELPASYRSRTLDFFSAKGRDARLAEKWVDSKAMYHVVNGGYEHEARWQLLEKEGYHFAGQTWRVIVIPWQEARVLKAIAIMSSQVQRKEFFIDLTFSEELVHLRSVMDYVATQASVSILPGISLPRGFAQRVITEFCGGRQYANTTLRHLVTVAGKMSLRMAEIIRDVIDEEVPHIAKLLESKKKEHEDSCTVRDDRSFRKLLNSKTLRGTKKFFDLTTTDEDRVNALYRAREISQGESNYRGVAASVLDRETECAILARHEIGKFSSIILSSSEWPPGMNTIRNNILRTGKLDCGILENKGKKDVLLTTLKHQYIKVEGTRGGTRIEQYEKRIRDEQNKGNDLQEDLVAGWGGGDRNGNETHALRPLAEQDQNNLLEINDTEVDNNESGTELATENVRTERCVAEDLQQENCTDAVLPLDERAASLDKQQHVAREECKSPLEKCDIQVYGISWAEYNKTILDGMETFDLLVSEPFQKSAGSNAKYVDDEERTQFAQFIRRVLVPGGHAFLILLRAEANQWIDAMKLSGMDILSPFHLIKETKTVQRTRAHSLQDPSEQAVVAVKPGQHPKGFNRDLDSPYSRLPENKFERRFSVISNIPSPPKPLFFPKSKAWVRTTEKAPALYAELMTTFCPSGGCVIVPHAGTMAEGIACIQSMRKCVLIEPDTVCLELARKRLMHHAIARITAEEAGVDLPHVLEDEHGFSERLPDTETDSGNSIGRDAAEREGLSFMPGLIEEVCENGSLDTSGVCAGNSVQVNDHRSYGDLKAAENPANHGQVPGNANATSSDQQTGEKGEEMNDKQGTNKTS